MLFKKKPAASPSESESRVGRKNRRRQYRVSATPEDLVIAGVERADGTMVDGACLDLSIGGAWVQLDAAPEQELAEDVVCTLRIRAALRPPIRVTSRVVAVRQGEDGSLRVGFQFTDRVELYSQLDEGYAELFNRRRHMRMRSDHVLRIPLRISWRGGSIPGMAFDLSEGGLGTSVPESRAKELERVTKVSLSFRLPGDATVIVCSATIQCRTRWRSECLLGLAFTPGGGIESYEASVRRCVEKRLAEFRAWKEGPGKKLRKRAS